MSNIMIGGIKNGSVSLTDIKNFTDSLPRLGSFQKNREIQKYIEKNSTLIESENISRGETIWLFGGAPQYNLARVKFLYKKSSNSPKMITLYVEEDQSYENWRKEDNRFLTFDSASSVALRVRPNEYYKSVKRDKKIPKG